MHLPSRSLVFLGCLLLGLVACNELAPGPEPEPEPEAECESSANCTNAEAPFCSVEGECAAPPPGGLIGWGNDETKLVEIYREDTPREAVDLAFHPERFELWVINRKTDSVVVIESPGTAEQTAAHLKDPAASHFMRRPPAIAMGTPSTWATCGDGDNGGNDFMGPALFSSDLEIFATQNPDTGLGSHLDMLHSTTFCRGIAHERDNAYWVFNSNRGSLDRYDFGVDHGPGNDDHSDGRIFRYAEGAVAGADGVSSHLVFDDGFLYVADTGNQRIARLDPSTATEGSSFPGLEPVDTRRRMDDAELIDIVPTGQLEAPSGLEIHDGVIYVSDNATGQFHAFDKEGVLLNTFDTGAPAGSLSGMAVGPDGKLYFTETLTSRVYRIDPK